MTPTPTVTRTRTATRTPTPTFPPLPGPLITWFGLTEADGRVVLPADSSDNGTLIFERRIGAGFFLVLEGRPGSSGSPPDIRNFFDSNNPGSRPDIEILTSRPLGNGSTEVCDKGPLNIAPLGGIPATGTIDFDSSDPNLIDALNDFSCRFTDYTSAPCTLDARERAVFVAGNTTVQVCTATVVGVEMRFPTGETTLTVRWRDRLGNYGRPYSIIVRVLPPALEPPA